MDNWRLVPGHEFNQRGWFVQHVSCDGIFLTSSEMHSCYYCNMDIPDYINLQLKLLLDGSKEE